jgi:outer membrane protein assembly factor BamA
MYDFAQSRRWWPMRTHLLASIATFALIALPLHVTAQDICTGGFVVSRITMPEATHLRRSEQAAISEQLIGRCLDESQLGTLVEQVQDALQRLGYFRATVTKASMAITDATRSPRTATLNLNFREGLRYRVGEIEIGGNRALLADQIYAFVPIAPGDYFDITEVREAADAVRKLYAANGYSNASIVPDVQFREDLTVKGEPAVRVILRIVESKPQME